MTLEKIIENLKEKKFIINEMEDYYIVKRKSGLYGILALIKKDGTNKIILATPYRDKISNIIGKYANTKK